MTPTHLAMMEAAARIYCAKVGMNPDHQVPMPHPTIQGVMNPEPFWRVVAEKMVDLAVMLAAMKEAAANKALEEVAGVKVAH